MTIIDDAALRQMSSQELIQLQAAIHDAIRAHIRLKNMRMAVAAAPRPAGNAQLPQVEQIRQRSLSVHAAINRVAPGPETSRPVPGTGEQPRADAGVDALARERDAWLTRKRSTKLK